MDISNICLEWNQKLINSDFHKIVDWSINVKTK